MASKKNRQDGSTRQLNDEESFFSLIERMYEDSGFELLDTNTPAVKEESDESEKYRQEEEPRGLARRGDGSEYT